ncbi:malonyl CoA-ACP transacylase [Acinetobacter sp. ANC 4558]|uniref:ACP S-malonyltransferase n=1 Tax=Acinetobacter sp. ANC 4558 TaxID=1977876 RepID=UPI000A33CC31|nr:ACP S-malonyltransferase [Acinetobacter sp. ANC 4558]OTG86252.1 malonyl CoA-ACP transacylase [Acinetobacter sp. ANC 4558]
MNIKELKSVAFMFAGQGNPTIGMGSDLWDINDTTRKIWDCASDISQKDIRRLCLRGPMNKLVQTTHQQLAVTAINISLYTLCRENMTSDIVAGLCGHSVGEYAALYAANAATLEDTFKMIQFRANLMHDLSQINKGSMYAVKGIDYQTLKKQIEHFGVEVDICCDNSPQQQVIGGTTDALTAFSRQLMTNGYETTKLGVSGAWHTRLMHTGVQQMRDYLASIPLQSPEYDVVMNVTGMPEKNPEIIKENLALHLTHTVKWTESMERLLNHTTAPVLLEVSNKAYLGHMLSDFITSSSEKTIHCRQMMGLS